MEEICKNCRWWKRCNKTKEGDCKIKAPGRFGTEKACHPVTAEDDFCGEFEPAK